jgi:hypothetical protein
MATSGKYSVLFTSHTNPILSGVAKFNQILSAHLDVPVLGLDGPVDRPAGSALLSLKLNDLLPGQETHLKALLSSLVQSSTPFDLFFHTFDFLPLEQKLVASARAIYCGNRELVQKISPLHNRVVLAWAPALMDRSKASLSAAHNFFCFGMAHKIQPWMHQNLRNVLDNLGADYTIWLSTAFHEKAKFGDFDQLSQTLLEIYGDRIRFLGFLSDDSVNYFLSKSTAMVAFFEKGLRANNTTVYAAMERSCPVITNLDGHSPSWVTHGKNILDVSHLKIEDLEAERLFQLGRTAEADVRAQASWPGLVSLLQKKIDDRITADRAQPAHFESTLR